MNIQERMLGVMRGTEIDRVPFVQYDNLGGKNEDIWEMVGKENMGILRWTQVHKFVHSKCKIVTEEIICDGELGFRDTMITPAGNLTQERVLVPGLKKVAHIKKHYIKSLEDYKILLYYLNDIEVIEDLKEAREVWEYVGDIGLPHIWIGRSPYQQLWIQWVSIMDLSLHLADDSSLLDDVMNLLGEIMLKQAKVAFNATESIKIPYINIGDNITAPMIGVERFERYCLPYYRKVSSLMEKKDIPLVVHMDGELKPLWHLIGESGVKGLDSFTPIPDNDTSAADAVSMWPEMRLLLNFPSSIHLKDKDTIYAEAMKILKEAGHTGRLQIQVSEDPPPGTWRNSYPQIIKAIEDFGRPSCYS